MFESAFAVEAPGRRSPILISFTLQSAAVAALVILPLFYVEQLTTMPTMPVPTYAPKLPHMKIISVMREAASAALAPRLITPTLRRPIQAPVQINPLPKGSLLADADAPVYAAPSGPGIPIDSAFLTPSRLAPPPAAPEAKPIAKPAAKATPTRVGGDVQAAKLIHQVRPIYPPLAKQARIQGLVRLQAAIARDGSIQNLALTSGHPLLVPAALEAVKQWRYRPTTLNGETVEVLTVIDVNFTLQQ